VKGGARCLARLLLGLLLALVLVVGALLAALSAGLTLGPFTLAGVSVEHLHAHLSRKLILQISDVRIPRQPSAQHSHEAAAAIDPSRVRHLLNLVGVLARGFAAIDIERVTYGELRVDFRFREPGRDQGAGHLHVHAPGADARFNLSMGEDQLHVAIGQLSAPGYGLDIDGEATIDVDQLTLTAALEGVIADTLPVSLALAADRKQLSFSGRGREPVGTIAPIVNLFRLSPKIAPWIVDYLQGSAFSLQQVRGKLPYDDPQQLLQNLVAEAHVLDTAYSFAQGLEPARAEETAVLFERGVLHIYPRQSTFYGQPGGDSYVEIDFNDGRFLLTVFVLTTAQASGGVLTLLEHYRIPFPYEQVSGLTDATLTLTIDLATRSLRTDGRFTASGDDSVIAVGSRQFRVPRFDIGLKNTEIAFNQLDVAVPDLLSASVGGVLDAAAGRGDLDIDVAHLRWRPPDSSLALQTAPAGSGEPALQLHVQLDPDGDSIDVAASDWRYGRRRIAVGPFTSPFSPATLSGSLERVDVDVHALMRLQVSGDYSASAPYARLDLLLQALGPHPVQLAQAPAAVSVTVGDGVHASTGSAIPLAVGGARVALQPSQVVYHNGVLQIDRSGIALADGPPTNIEGRLDIARRTGQLSLSGLNLATATLGTLLTSTEKMAMDLRWGAGETRLAAPALGLSFAHHNAGGWMLSSGDLGKIAVHSPLLRRYQVGDGRLEVSSATGGLPYDVRGKLTYPHALLVEAGAPMHDYRFQGQYRGTATDLTVNDKVQVALTDTVRITSSDVGYSLPALFAILKAHAEHTEPSPPAATPGTATASPDREAPAEPDRDLRLHLHASNTAVYLNDNQRVLANGLNATYAGGKAHAELYYRSGSAHLEYGAQGFHLVGQGLDDSFMNALTTDATFTGGALEFRAQGQPQSFKAAVRIDNSTVTGFKTLYNILALVDTVPALLTFDLPDYNSHGLPMQEAYAGFDVAEGLVRVNTVRLEAKEMTLQGAGTIDLGRQTVDLHLNFISGAHKSIEKIPLLGYVLTGGEDKPSMTIEVEGKLKEPNISQTAFKEVATYPFAVIARTIMLPAHMAMKFKQHRKEKKTSEETKP